MVGIISSSLLPFILPAVTAFTTPSVRQQTYQLDAGKTLYDKIFEDHTVRMDKNFAKARKVNPTDLLM